MLNLKFGLLNLNLGRSRGHQLLDYFTITPTLKIFDNVHLEHGGLPHVFPLAVQGTTPRPFYSLGWVVRGSSVGLASCRVGPASLGVAQMAIKDR